MQVGEGEVKPAPHGPVRDHSRPAPHDQARHGPRRRVPRFAIVYAIGAAVVIAWAAHLGFSLPGVDIARHWNVAWVGLDCFIAVALAHTAWRAGHNDRRVVIPAVATATLLIVDAWMDITTATRANLWESLLLAALLELPLAALSLLVAHRALDHLDPRTRRPRVERGGIRSLISAGWLHRGVPTDRGTVSVEGNQPANAG